MTEQSITLDELRDVVRGFVKTHGYNGTGRKLGLSAQFVHSLAKADGSLPGDKALAALGYEQAPLRYIKAEPSRRKRRVF